MSGGSVALSRSCDSSCLSGSTSGGSRPSSFGSSELLGPLILAKEVAILKKKEPEDGPRYRSSPVALRASKPMSVASVLTKTGVAIFVGLEFELSGALSLSSTTWEPAAEALMSFSRMGASEVPVGIEAQSTLNRVVNSASIHASRREFCL